MELNKQRSIFPWDAERWIKCNSLDPAVKKEMMEIILQFIEDVETVYGPTAYLTNMGDYWYGLKQTYRKAKALIDRLEAEEQYLKEHG